MLTLRQIGAVGIKLLGVSYLARTIVAGFSLLALRFAPPDPGLEGDFAVAQLVGTVGYPVAALFLLAAGDVLAATLIPATPVKATIEVRDLLAWGVALVGVSLAASAVPALLQGLGIAVYYAEGARQQFAEARFERMGPEMLREFLTLCTGIAVAMASRLIASRLQIQAD